MRRSPLFYVPRLEGLEARVTPALTTVYDAMSRTLTIKEVSAGDDTITLTTSGLDQVTVTASNGTVLDTVANGSVSFGPATKPVRNVVAKLGTGTDRINVSNAGSPNFSLRGNLTVNFTTGTKTVFGIGASASTDSINIGGNLSISSTVGDEKTVIMGNVTVARAVTIRSTAGDTTTLFGVIEPGTNVNSLGSLRITNGPGFDYNELQNMNVAGNVTINNGLGNDATGGGSQNTLSNTGAAGGIKVGGGVTISNTSGVSVVNINAPGFFPDPVGSYTNMGFLSTNHSTKGMTIAGGVRLSLSGGTSVAPSQVFLGNGQVAGGTLAVGAVDIKVGGSDFDVEVDNTTVNGGFAYRADSGSSNNSVLIGWMGPGVDLKGRVRVAFGDGGFNFLGLATGSAVHLGGLSLFDGGSGVADGATVVMANLTGTPPVLRQFVEFP